jgi:hypothetical protein
MRVQITLQGTLKPDGTLELDQKVPMPEGRVLVTVQSVAVPEREDLFWQKLAGIWAARAGSSSTNALAAERPLLRDGMDDEIQEAIQLQNDCRRNRQQAADSLEPTP